MKIIHYTADSRWVGKIKCAACGYETPAWQSSGMSDNYPHFYCDSCSNVIHRESDKESVYKSELTQELLDNISASLPSCPCGGKFRPGMNPKCPKCHTEFPIQSEPVQRLTDPHMILLDGACLIRDRLYSYQVSIGSRLTY